MSVTYNQLVPAYIVVFFLATLSIIYVVLTLYQYPVSMLSTNAYYWTYVSSFVLFFGWLFVFLSPLRNTIWKKYLAGIALILLTAGSSLIVYAASLISKETDEIVWTYLVTTAVFSWAATLSFVIYLYLSNITVSTSFSAQAS